MFRKMLLVGNLLGFLSLIVMFIIVYFFPQKLQSVGLSLEMGQVVLLQVISLLLLFTGLQENLGRWWRRSALGASFVILGESILISALKFV